MQDMNAFNLQLQMHTSFFFLLNIKTLNADIWTFLNIKKKSGVKVEMWN